MEKEVMNIYLVKLLTLGKLGGNEKLKKTDTCHEDKMSHFYCFQFGRDSSRPPPSLPG